MLPMTPARLPSPSTVWRCAAMRMRRGCTASAAMHTGNAARIRCMTRWTAPGTACRDAQYGRRLRGVWRLRRLHGQRAGADEHAGQAWHQTVENGDGWRAINYWISTVASPHACDGLIAQAKKCGGRSPPAKTAFVRRDLTVIPCGRRFQRHATECWHGRWNGGLAE